MLGYVPVLFIVDTYITASNIYLNLFLLLLANIFILWKVFHELLEPLCVQV